MKLIIDTNVLISGLIKDSTTRRILFGEKFTFYIPEKVIVEVNKYIPEICQKSNLTQIEIQTLLNLILEHLNVVPLENYQKKLEKAREIMSTIDEKDTQFIALAISFKNNGIWSNDKHIRKQEKIKVYTTSEIIKIL